ncbi:MAG: PEPxxWA-CTERM sorting domain-containing protein [Parasphingorhabdus sp.]|uniref:PEPxxWA-CTERM sorting domain-containing protein n=1 Tax=Parasphingorhabdus sp. TaxID=2709688 RepID=UPI0032985E9C
MSDNLSGLIASADRRRRTAILLFGGAIGLAALFPHNDRAMWVPESETPFVFTAVPERLPVTYLSIPGADTLLRTLGGFPGDGVDRRLRRRLLPGDGDPTFVAPPSGAGNTGNAANNIPNATVPEFGDLPTELADAQTAPGGPLGPGGGGTSPTGPSSNPGGVPGGIGGGGPGTFNNPQTPVDDTPGEENPPMEEPPIMSAVPEPVTWAMFILGFGMIGTALRRRKSTKAASNQLAVG